MLDKSAGLLSGELVRLPEGVEAVLRVYLYSPATDLEAVFDVKGLTSLPTSPMNAVDVAKIMPPNVAKDVPTDWRVMTREEIADYRNREREEKAAQDRATEQLQSLAQALRE